MTTDHEVEQDREQRARMVKLADDFLDFSLWIATQPPGVRRALGVMDFKEAIKIMRVMKALDGSAAAEPSVTNGSYGYTDRLAIWGTQPKPKG